MAARKKKDNNDEEPEVHKVDAEHIPATPPIRRINLNVNRTKRIVQSVLDMDDEEANKLLKDQVTTKLLLINDIILYWIEVHEGSDEWNRKMLAARMIETMTGIASQITKSKIEIDKALGKHLEAFLPENAPTIGDVADREMTPEEFAKFTEDTIKQLGTGQVAPTKLGHG